MQSPSTSAAPAARPQSSAASLEALVQIRELLFPTDLTPESDRAFAHARFLAERFQAGLTIYHAVEVPDPSYAHWAFQRGREIWINVEHTARELLARRAETLHVSHKLHVERVGSAQHALLEFIRETQPDLTVMATHGRQGLSHLLLGSVAENVFRRSYRPTLCVREPEHGEALPYKRILVPTDLSLASRLVFPMAALFAHRFGAEILAVHVAGHGPLPEPTEAWLWKFFERDFPAVEVTAQVHRGSVWRRIVETARVEKVDLILMSTRGHDSLADRVIGSNTERVVRHAPCPVLVA